MIPTPPINGYTNTTNHTAASYGVPSTAAPLPPPGAIRRGDRVALTIAACVRCEVPRESAGGVVRELWVEDKAAVLLVEVRLSDRTVEAVVGPEDVTKEA